MPLTPENISRHDIEQFREIDCSKGRASDEPIALRYREIAVLLRNARDNADRAKEHADEVRDQVKGILIAAKARKIVGPDFKITWNGSERAGALDTAKLDAFLKTHGTSLEAFRGPPSDINTVLCTFKSNGDK